MQVGRQVRDWEGDTDLASPGTGARESVKRRVRADSEGQGTRPDESTTGISGVPQSRREERATEHEWDQMTSEWRWANQKPEDTDLVRVWNLE